MGAEQTEQVQGYVVRRMTPADAEGMPALAERIYGSSYIHAEVYHPDRMMRLNSSGQLISVVALDSSGRVVGHDAIERPDLGRVGELGEAMVMPEHQHHHLLERMCAMLEDEARKHGMVGLFGDAVTHHVFSQLASERFKSEPIAIILAALPAAADNLQGKYPQRLSFLCHLKYLAPQGEAVVHLPAHHREIADRIFGRLGRRLAFAEGRSSTAPGEIEISYLPDKRRGMIHVVRPGADSAERIGEAARELCAKAGAQVVFVDIPLSEPASAELCVALEDQAFFFGGFRPRDPATGEVIRMQLLNDKLDFGLVQIASDFGRELLAYVAAEYERVSGRSFV
jgi:hypothetical protein